MFINQRNSRKRMDLDRFLPVDRNQLITNSALDSLLTKYEWVIVPTLNSDG